MADAVDEIDDTVASSNTLEDLGDDDLDELMATMGQYHRADGNPTDRSPEEVVADIDQLASEDVDGLSESIRHGSGNLEDGELTDSVRSFRGIDGEADAATNILDEGESIDELEVRVPEASDPDAELDIDLRSTRDSAVEVKNTDYDFFESEENEIIKAREKERLESQIETATQYMSDEGGSEYVFATRTSDPGANEIISTAIDDADVPDDVTITRKTIDEVGTF